MYLKLHLTEHMYFFLKYIKDVFISQENKVHLYHIIGQTPKFHYVWFIKNWSSVITCKIFDFNFILGNYEGSFFLYLYNTICVYPTGKVIYKFPQT